MMRSLLLFLLACAAMVVASCSDPAPQVPYNKIEKEDPNARLLEMNKEFAAIEDSLIRAYVDSSKVPFTTTKSGLRYCITNYGVGDSVRKTDDVTFRYTVRPLDGVACDKLTDAVKTVNLEKGDLERGFREALLMLRTSGSGIFVMPSFLGYGVVGVPKCIPAWTPVECHITLIEIEKK